MENIEELKEHVKFVTNLCMPGSGLEELIELSVKDDISARLFLMAVSSIRDAASVREIFSGTDKDYENSINKKLADMYTPFDNLNKKINEANDLAVKVTSANKEIRDMFQREIKQSFEREKAAQEELKKQYGETLIAKDKAYNLMAEKADEAERKLEGLIKENEQLKNNIEDIKKKAQQSSIKQRVLEEQPEEPERTRLFAGFKKKKPKNDNAAYIYETFMNEILMNKDFSDEQKNFLIDCLDENMPYEEIKRLAKPELDVAMMKRLKIYYKKRIK
ncbi:uncharacterized protein BN798_01431 [Eubacterium sp. CAG:86]|nr:uncharacterized protein BN798_01431 [Eubacterium sp. CAG:86]